MVHLAKVAESLNVKLDEKGLLITTNPKGRKRRPWLQDELPEEIRDKLDNRLDSLGNTLGYSDNKSGNLGNKLDHKLGNKLDNGLDNETINFLLSALAKGKEKIFKHFLHICIKNGSCSTGKILSSKMSSEINIPYPTLKTTLVRLLKSNLIRRNQGKTSRSGYIDIHIYKNVKDSAILYYGRNLSNGGLGNNLEHGLDNKPNSSSSNINTTTNKDGKEQNQLFEKWKNIDIEPLSMIGFAKIHLNQIASQNILSPQIIQDSIYAFAFDLQKNDKLKTIKGDPINFFMGIIRNGKPYVPPSNYESPQDKAMRLYAEKMKEIEQKRSSIEKEAINLAFNEWFPRLTDSQKRELLPENMRVGARLEKNKFLESSARSKFEIEIWPAKKLEIVGDNENADKAVNSEGEGTM
jgi:hypothetical protein